jgi:hypothetical protein
MNTVRNAGRGLTRRVRVAKRVAVGLGAALTIAVAFPAAANAANGWTYQPVPLLGGSSQGGLEGVSCISAADCVAVGYTQSGSLDLPMAEYWNGSAWTQRVPAQPVAHRYLQAVSCSAYNACMATGEWAGNSGVADGPPVSENN